MTTLSETYSGPLEDQVGWRQYQPEQIEAMSRRLPGMRLILLGLLITFVTAARQVLHLWGVPVPLRLFAQAGGVLAVICIMLGGYYFTRGNMTSLLIHPRQRMKVAVWRAVVIVAFILGLAVGNLWNVAGKEFVLLMCVATLLIVGADDRFWYAIIKPLTVLFYLSVPLMFLYYDTAALIVGHEEVREMEPELVGIRYMHTIGANLRPLFGGAMLLCMWGLVSRQKGAWRVLQVMALPLAFIAEVAIFKFRGMAIAYAISIVSFLLLRPMLEYRRRPGTTALLITAGLITAIVFFSTAAGQVLAYRFFERTQEEPIFQSRLQELDAFVDDMGAELLIGRGLGGTFNASHVFETDESHYWGILHLGFLVFQLKGGVLMLLLFVSFLLPGLIFRPKSWYQNPCNLTAALMLPYVLFQFLLNPLVLSPAGIIMYASLIMVLARFGRITELDGPEEIPAALSLSE